MTTNKTINFKTYHLNHEKRFQQLVSIKVVYQLLIQIDNHKTIFCTFINVKLEKKLFNTYNLE